MNVRKPQSFSSKVVGIVQIWDSYRVGLYLQPNYTQWWLARPCYLLRPIISYPYLQNVCKRRWSLSLKRYVAIYECDNLSVVYSVNSVSHSGAVIIFCWRRFNFYKVFGPDLVCVIRLANRMCAIWESFLVIIHTVKTRICAHVWFIITLVRSIFIVMNNIICVKKLMFLPV